MRRFFRWNDGDTETRVSERFVCEGHYPPHDGHELEVFTREDIRRGVDIEPDSDIVWLNFWYHYHSNKSSLWQRIKDAWRLIRGYNIHYEEFIFNPSEARSLGHYLKTNSEFLLRDSVPRNSWREIVNLTNFFGNNESYRIMAFLGSHLYIIDTLLEGIKLSKKLHPYREITLWVEPFVDNMRRGRYPEEELHVMTTFEGKKYSEAREMYEPIQDWYFNQNHAFKKVVNFEENYIPPK